MPALIDCESDDNGSSFRLGATHFGSGAHWSNECQAVELRNGSVLIITRSISDPDWRPRHLSTLSNDGGLTFTDTKPIASLPQPKGGVEGSLVRDSSSGALYYSTTTGPIGPVRWAGAEMPIDAGARQNLRLFVSHDEASSWQLHTVVDSGLTSYSSLAVLAGGVGVLWETGYTAGTPAAIVFREVAAPLA